MEKIEAELQSEYKILKDGFKCLLWDGLVEGRGKTKEEALIDALVNMAKSLDGYVNGHI